MGTVIFWLCFLLLVILLIVSSLGQDSRKKAARRERIRKSFESSSKECFTAGRFDETISLLGYMKESYPDDFVIDDTTVSDLGLRDLFIRMNRTVTNAGEDYLYCRFRMMQKDSDRISGIYDTVESFGSDANRAVMLQNILDGCPKRDDADDFELIRSLSTANSAGFAWDIVPLAALIVSLCLMPFNPLVGIVATIISIIVCIATYFYGRNIMDESLRGLALALKYINCAIELAEAKVGDFDSYKRLFLFSKASFLIPYKDGTTSNPLSLIFDYVRMITHIDLITYKIRIAGIKKEHDSLIRLYISTGRLDACIAVASFLRDRKHCRSLPQKSERFHAEGLYHPLIELPVCNDIDTDKGIVITGSNASGKSTFLKAVGISTLFSQSFGIAFASSFETGMFDLYSSMALSDDLLGGDSYYVVEAKSLKRICDAAKKGSVLCIVDEVLRGTNTVERIAASSRILKFLARPGVLCFAATHDLEIPAILAEDLDSYYFTEEVTEGNVTFPYVINKGTTDKTNAIRLLLFLGFDPEIVDPAINLALKYKHTGKWVDDK